MLSFGGLFGPLQWTSITAVRSQKEMLIRSHKHFACDGGVAQLICNSVPDTEVREEQDICFALLLSFPMTW